MERVLLVEDDNDIAQLVSVNLAEISIEVDYAETGEVALKKFEKSHYGLVLLDVMLPGISGLDVCRQIRDQKPEQAILILTSRDTELDRVLGLELGADDYMTKPFSVRELQARVRTQLRRFKLLNALEAKCQHELTTATEENQTLVLGDLAINNLTHSAYLAGKPLELTSTEYDLLYFLASHPEQVFSRDQLLSSVWGYHHSGYEHTVNSHINRLRNKLEQDAAQPQIVQTVWGVGYKFNRQGVAA
ncbi:winged helix-turn-helix domain-containing protein [Thalassotalea fusca]